MARTVGPHGRTSGSARSESPTRHREVGFQVHRCPGPNGWCPPLIGGSCPISERPAAVIVRTPDRSDSIPVYFWALGVPTLVVREGGRMGPRFGAHVAWIGEARGPTAAVEALDQLLARTAPPRSPS